MIKWLFDIDALRLSTGATTHSGTPYLVGVLPDSFGGVTERWDISGNGLIAPNDLDFEIGNESGTYTEADFEGKDCLVQLVINDVVELAWKFKIKRAISHYKKIKCYCADFLQQHLTGDYPNTKSPKEIWPSTDADADDDYCVPVILGTAYIPLRSITTGVAGPTGEKRYYVLGAEGTYTVSEVKTPHQWPAVKTYTAAEYDMLLSASGGYQLLQPVLQDTTLDGTADSVGLWRPSSVYLDMLCKYSRSTTASITNPADWVELLLVDFGVPSVDIDSTTFTAAGTSFSTDSITLNGGWWQTEAREYTLSDVLAHCDSFLVCRDKVELMRFSTVSQETIDNVLLLSFSPSKITRSVNDSGRVHWPESTDKPMDVLNGKAVVPTYPLGTEAAISSEIFYARFLAGQSQNAQTAAMLRFQKKFEQKQSVNFSVSLLDLTKKDISPGQVLTINNALYGGEYKVIVTQKHITHGLRVNFTGVTLYQLHDWGDITATAITPVEDDSEGFPLPSDDIYTEFIFKEYNFQPATPTGDDPAADPESGWFK